jgi:hypothetical protein
MASYYMGIKFDTVDELIEYQDKIGKLPGGTRVTDGTGQFPDIKIPPLTPRNPWDPTPPFAPPNPQPFNPGQIWCTTTTNIEGLETGELFSHNVAFDEGIANRSGYCEVVNE